MLFRKLKLEYLSIRTYSQIVLDISNCVRSIPLIVVVIWLIIEVCRLVVEIAIISAFKVKFHLTATSTTGTCALAFHNHPNPRHYFCM
jgi:hypothetical protein